MNTVLATSSPCEGSQKSENNNESGSSCGRRTAGKGRRRRIAAEMKRIELERLGQMSKELEDDSLPRNPQKIPSRRKLRRARRNAVDDALDDYEDYVDEEYRTPSRLNLQDEALELDLALALSLSLEEGGSSMVQAAVAHRLDMSYENLVVLEDVKKVACEAAVNNLNVIVFPGHSDEDSSEEICSICQGEFVEGDKLMILPCCHKLHDQCGKEWLLKYSKLCPVCKYDVSEI